MLIFCVSSWVAYSGLPVCPSHQSSLMSDNPRLFELAGADSSPLKDGPCGCGGVVHGEVGAHGGCGCAASVFGGCQGWPCAPDPRMTSSSSGLGCCWLASGPCWTALPRNPATQPISYGLEQNCWNGVSSPWFECVRVWGDTGGFTQDEG